MGRFFAVNPAVVISALFAIALVWGNAFYLYGVVYGWKGAEAVAIEEMQARGLTEFRHDSTHEYGDNVRVLFAAPTPGHFADMTVSRDRLGKWVVTAFDKDFQPWKKDEPSR
mgnify:CR=1 FL=1